MIPQSPQSPSHDAHARAPEAMKAFFKQWQKSSPEDLSHSPDLVDFTRNIPEDEIRQCQVNTERRRTVDKALQDFLAQDNSGETSSDTADRNRQSVTYESINLPGFFMFPSLLSPEIQIGLLDKLLHRDLFHPDHKTNVHLHYHVVYPKEQESTPNQSKVSPKSFFDVKPDLSFTPKNSTLHNPLTVEQMLQQKLRWMTLGGQYDWTAKQYSNEKSPKFPPDIANLLRGLFPQVDAQAAIVNFYTPGDTLSVHRDVSEDCDKGLISISIGCDGIFIAGNEDGSQKIAVRVRSGDAVLLSGPSRFAWHAMARIVPGSCPSWLDTWPSKSEGDVYEHWRGWMRTKRINLNVRQMRDTPFSSPNLG